jgi:hypothetical protein
MGHLEVAQWLLQVKPDINISARDELVFIEACFNGRLNVARWLLQVCPTIHISVKNDLAFRLACRNGHLHLAQWAFRSAYNEGAFRLACENGHLDVAQWLQSLKPYLYVIIYDENGNIKDYKIRNKEEANWQRRKYLVWLASNDCVEENKHNLLYKLPSDVSRMVILHL